MVMVRGSLISGTWGERERGREREREREWVIVRNDIMRAFLDVRLLQQTLLGLPVPLPLPLDRESRTPREREHTNEAACQN